MPKYQVVIEQLSQEIISIDAENESEAEELVREGGGEVLDSIMFSPSIIDTSEIEVGHIDTGSFELPPVSLDPL
jgi:hypothetical protein